MNTNDLSWVLRKYSDKEYIINNVSKVKKGFELAGVYKDVQIWQKDNEFYCKFKVVTPMSFNGTFNCHLKIKVDTSSDTMRASEVVKELDDYETEYVGKNKTTYSMPNLIDKALTEIENTIEYQYDEDEDDEEVEADQFDWIRNGWIFR